MYEYKLDKFYPQVHDFGDGYHDPDEEAVVLDRDLLSRVKKLKRRYRNYNEFCDAMKAYQEYTNYLIDKYGGKKRFRFAYGTGQVTDFIPFKPELRDIKVNKKYIYEEAVPVDITEETDAYSQEMYDINHNNPDKVSIDFKIGAKLDYDVEHSLGKSAFDTVQELNIIESYWERHANRPRKLSKKTKKEQKRDMLRRQYADYISLTDRLNEREKAMFQITEPIEDRDKVIAYKGTMITNEQAVEIEIDDILRGYGIYLNKRNFSKKTRRVVRSKKKKSKKNNKLNKYLESFSEGISDYNSFEREMSELISTKIREKD